jgi:hypothetical protein
MALRRGVAPIWPTIRLKFVVRIRVPVNLPISTELLLSARTSLRQRQIRVSTASLLEVTPVRVGQSVRTADVLLAVRILAASLRVAGGFRSRAEDEEAPEGQDGVQPHRRRPPSVPDLVHHRFYTRHIARLSIHARPKYRHQLNLDQSRSLCSPRDFWR